MVSRVLDSLLTHGRVVRSWLGVNIQDLDAELASALGSELEAGVLVSGVVPDSPADDAGLSRGDIIVGLDGEAIDSAAQLRNLVSLRGVDRRVNVDIVRDGRSRKLTAKLGTLPGQVATSASPDTAAGRLEGVVLGEVDERFASRFDIEVAGVGAGVREVEPGSPAARAGLRPGDVILEVNRRRVRALSDVTGADASRPVLLLVQRGAGASYLVVR